MWEQSMLTLSGQVEALRLLSEWWDGARRDRAPWGRRRAVGATMGTVVVDPEAPSRPPGTRVVGGPTPAGR